MKTPKLLQAAGFLFLGFSFTALALADQNKTKDFSRPIQPGIDNQSELQSSGTILDLSLDRAVFRQWQESSKSATWLAAVDNEASTAGSDATEKPLSSECAAYQKDVDADLGDVLKAGCKPTLAQMSALMDNPIGNVAMFFNQYDSYTMEDPETGNEAVQSNYMALLQFPKKLNKDWNLINRIVFNVTSVPLDQDKIDDFDFGSGPGGGPLPPPDSDLPAPIDLFDGRTTDLGDTYYVGLFAPEESTILEGGGKFLWGVGFDLGFPTAQEDILGTGKYTGGPSALAVYIGSKWKVGALAQHYADFAGDDDRSDVNMTNIQYLVYYALNDTTSIGAGPNIIANWEQGSGDVWTVPIGFGINKTFQFGKVPVRFGFEVHYSAIQPDDALFSKWDYRFYIIPAVPSALFGWMQ